MLNNNNTEYIAIDTCNHTTIKNARFNEHVKCVHVKINDIVAESASMIQSIQDTAWISKLDAFDEITLTKTTQRSIATLLKTYDECDESKSLMENIGEYLVTTCAQDALFVIYTHEKIPLAELLKEKVRGNPGFDFHTISQNNVLIFGEGKSSLDSTCHTSSVNQIYNFIEDEKDHAELATLKAFLNEDVKRNIVDKIKGYAAAFSVQSEDSASIFKKVMQLQNFSKIAENEEVYIIAVEVC